MVACIICNEKRNLIYRGKHLLQELYPNIVYSIERLDRNGFICEDCLLAGAQMDNPSEIEKIVSEPNTEPQLPINLELYNRKEILKIIRVATKIITETQPCHDFHVTKNG